MFNRIDKGMYWDRAWKLVEGCTPVSAGCAHCWSAKETHMRAKNPNAAIAKRNKGLTTKGCGFNGKIRLRKDNLELPVRTEKPTVWAVWNDLFHDDVPFEFIRDVFDSMWAADQHIFMLLTKRPMNMMASLNQLEIELAEVNEEWPLPNVWIGVTAENQEQLDKRWTILSQIPAAKRYVSIEPMLSSVLIPHSAFHTPHSIDWIICGGESGTGARPMHPDWARALRDQCHAAGVPFFFKQWGEWCPSGFNITDGETGDSSSISLLPMVRIGKKAAGKLLDGKEHLELPRRTA